jgi:hypothetical protein
LAGERGAEGCRRDPDDRPVSAPAGVDDLLS